MLTSVSAEGVGTNLLQASGLSYFNGLRGKKKKTSASPTLFLCPLEQSASLPASTEQVLKSFQLEGQPHTHLGQSCSMLAFIPSSLCPPVSTCMSLKCGAVIWLAVLPLLHFKASALACSVFLQAWSLFPSLFTTIDPSFMIGGVVAITINFESERIIFPRDTT